MGEANNRYRDLVPRRGHVAYDGQRRPYTIVDGRVRFLNPGDPQGDLRRVAREEKLYPTRR
jgi:hypothetical protein